MLGCGVEIGLIFCGNLGADCSELQARWISIISVSVGWNFDFTRISCSVLCFRVTKIGGLTRCLIGLYRCNIICFSCLNLGGGTHFKMGLFGAKIFFKSVWRNLFLSL